MTVKLSVIIPLFNEEDNLEPLYARLKQVMHSTGKTYEIIFIDDGSTDNSFQILSELHRKDKQLKIIRFTRNFGHDIARAAGLNYCSGDCAVLMDADLQDRPEEIPKLLAKLDEGYDVVFGRRKRRKDTFFKRLTSKLYLNLLATLTNHKLNPEIGPLQVMTRRVIDYMKEIGERSRFYGGLLGWLGFPYLLVDVEHDDRYAGKTKYNLWKLTRYAIEGIVSFSELPLHLAGYFGLIVSFFSFVLGIYMILSWFIWDVEVAGYTSIVVSVFFLGGVILVVLGVIGQYIGKIHNEVKQRPLYVVREIVE